MVVIRIGGHGHEDLIESKPCKNCISIMQQLNIKQVSYTTNNDGFNTEKITQIKTQHLSQMARKIKQV